jgi:hypothetical protein
MVVQGCVRGCESEDLRTRGSDIQGQEKIEVPAEEKNELALPPLCSLLGHSMAWVMPICMGEDRSFSLLIWMPVSSRNILTVTPRNNVLLASYLGIL